MNKIALYEFNGKSVRVIFLKGEPWFVAKDVLAEMESTTTVTALEALISEDLGKEFVTNQPLQTAGGKQKMLCLSEPALTLFVSRSRTELGKQLNRWIHTEVLPSIRKTGSYSLSGKSQDWLQARQDGKDARRELTDAIKDYLARHPELSPNAQKFLYSNASDALNLGLFGKRSNQLKKLLNISSLRDGLDKKELMCLNAIEYLCIQLIDCKDTHPVDAIKQAIEFSQTHRRFAEKFLALQPEQ